MQKKKKNKTIGKDDPSGEPRSLNEFIDDILCHIISFLPTTELAARTSVLSKRWRYMWTCLEVMKLSRKFTLLLSPQISLSNLKILTLLKTPFTDYHALNILFAASALKELKLHHCEWQMDTPGELIISAPKLQTLHISEKLEYQHPSVHARLALSSITVSAPIINFEYCGFVIRDFRFSFSSSIQTAMILFTADYSHIESIHLHHFNEVLRSLRFVSHLDLPASAVMAPSLATLPILKNVTSLALSENIVDLNSKEIKMILNKFPCLETLMLLQGIFDWELEEEDAYDINQLCPNFSRLSSLKNIRIGRFDGCMKEFAWVKILLEKATSLETMEINLNEMEDISKKDEIITLLCDIPKGSQFCYFEFC